MKSDKLIGDETEEEVYASLLASFTRNRRAKPRVSAAQRAEERWAAKSMAALRQDAERANAALAQREEEEAERWKRKCAASASAAIKKMLEREDDPL
jgi:hypothetical protein